MDNGQWTMDNGQWTMDNGQWNNGQGTMDNRIWNNGTRNKNIDIVSAHRTMRDKERDHETMRKRKKSWYVTEAQVKEPFHTAQRDNFLTMFD